jgi:hypothetical protein
VRKGCGYRSGASIRRTRRRRSPNGARQKRTDLRLVGLALVVTRDGGVPVVSHAYRGDRPDVTLFSTINDELVVRYRELTRSDESLTVVDDAGQNSCDNHAAVEESGLGFVDRCRHRSIPTCWPCPGRRTPPLTSTGIRD